MRAGLGYLDDGSDYGAEFYFDDWYNSDFEGGDIVDSGGGIIDYAPGFDSGSDEIPYADYQQSWGLDEPDYGSTSFDLPTFDNTPWIVDTGYSPTDAQQQYQSWYQEGGYDPLGFALYQQIDEPYKLPDVGNWGNIPYSNSFYDSWISPPYIPIIPETVPPPPIEEPFIGNDPVLPPACPGGSYHPYPIGHPQQNVCVPFPETPQSQTQPKPQTGSGSSSGSSGGSGSGSKPSTQTCPTGYCKHPTTGQCIPIPAGYQRDPSTQVCKPITQQQQQQTACPTGYYRHPQTGQCLRIPTCTTPGTVFDPVRGLCVPPSQVSPLPGTSEFDDLFASLKTVPWWIWLALGGAFLLSQGGDNKTTTVRYRRAA